MEFAGFDSLVDKLRGGAFDPGGFIKGKHGHHAGAASTPKRCSVTALADNTNAFGLNGYLGSGYHRRSPLF
jgi:hypothetical protein